MKPTVFLVDDDEAVRDGLKELLEANRLRVKTFGSAEEFLEACRPDIPGCVVLDVRLPGISGPKLQQQLVEREIRLPIVFLSGFGDVPTTVQALKGGAIDFLEKPVAAETLLERVRAALDVDAERRKTNAFARHAQARYKRLTAREREVMTLVVGGVLKNKDIARRLGISPRTVEVHRARVMHKMGAQTLLELIDFAQLCGLRTARAAAPAAEKAAAR